MMFRNLKITGVEKDRLMKIEKIISYLKLMATLQNRRIRLL